MVCSICNHNWQTSVNNRFLKGSGCPKCASKAKGANQKLSIDFIKQEAHKLSFWEVLSEEYISAKTKLLCRCKTCGIIHNISWDKLRQGQRCYTISKLGEVHWNWQGGKSFEPYCPIWKDYDYKESIKLRDAYVCQNPYCYKTFDRLHIHHIDYNKQNCHPSNLITVCGSCNIRANKDREWHSEWYQIIMNKQYGYNY